jgi:isopentenyl-diphosphate delta-isomerase
MRNVILTNEQGDNLGEMEIWEAHKGNGRLHKAFSVLIFTPDRTKVLLQKRADWKLFGLHWANSCCSHPKPKEDPLANATKRLTEEMGIDCELTYCGAFTYRAPDPNGKGSEYEYDMVFMGIAEENVTITPDPKEVADYRWVTIDDLKKEENIAPWFPRVLDIALAYHG